MAGPVEVASVLERPISAAKRRTSASATRSCGPVGAPWERPRLPGASGSCHEHYQALSPATRFPGGRRLSIVPMPKHYKVLSLHGRLRGPRSIRIKRRKRPLQGHAVRPRSRQSLGQRVAGLNGRNPPELETRCRDQAHTNGIESFWATLKRGYHGTFHRNLSRRSTVSVRCAPPNGADFDGLVSTIDSGHLGALYGCEAEEAALAG